MSDQPIAVGQPAPDFSLPAHIGKSPLGLADLRGQPIVLAFYALDFTGGWRTELKALQANLARFAELNAHVLGISVDSVYSHQAFAQELGGLTFPLLADFHPKGGMAQAYGVWREERGYSQRAIIVVDGEGIVRHSEVFPRSLPEAEAVLNLVHGLAGK